MMEQTVLEYLANALWQLPLLTVGAWLVMSATRPGPRLQHGMWLAALLLALVLPGVRSSQPAIAAVGNATAVVPDEPVEMSRVTVKTAEPAFAMPVEISIPILADEMSIDTAVRPGRRWSVRVPPYVAHGLVGLFAVSLLLGAIRIGRAWRVARRLVRNSEALELPLQQRTAWGECAERFGVQLPQIRQSCAIHSPVIVGATDPVLLLPQGFARHTEDEVRAVLCHELAHIARRDYLANLLCLVAALPLVWHPVSHEVQRRIGRTREMACDQMAAEAMESEVVYARCLLALARQMLTGSTRVERVGVVGLLGHNVLEERLMRLMARKTTMTVRAKVVRGMSGALAMAAVIVAAAMVRVTPTLAATLDQPAGSIATQAPAAPGVIAAPAVSESAPQPTQAPAGLPPASAPVSPVAPAASLAAPAASPTLDAGAGQSASPDATSSTGAFSSSASSSASSHVDADGSSAVLVPSNSAHGSDPGHSFSMEQHGDGKFYVTRDGVRRELTPAECAEMRKKIQAEVDAATARLRSPEFRKQMTEMQRQLAESQAKLYRLDAEKYRLDAEKQAKLFQSPALTIQLDKLNNPEFKKQMDDAQKALEAASAKLQSPEFKLQLEQGHLEALKGLQVADTAEMQRKLDAATRQMDAASRQMDAASKRLEQATRALQEAQARMGKDK